MTDKNNEAKATSLRRMKCPYCGYECETRSIGAIYCGPHRASMGPATYPAVQMVPANAA